MVWEYDNKYSIIRGEEEETLAVKVGDGKLKSEHEDVSGPM
jgi:hypothetical protein